MTTDIITPMQLADLRRQVEEVALQAGRFLKESRLNFSQNIATTMSPT